MFLSSFIKANNMDSDQAAHKKANSLIRVHCARLVKIMYFFSDNLQVDREREVKQCIYWQTISRTISVPRLLCPY